MEIYLLGIICFLATLLICFFSLENTNQPASVLKALNHNRSYWFMLGVALDFIFSIPVGLWLDSYPQNQLPSLSVSHPDMLSGYNWAFGCIIFVGLIINITHIAILPNIMASQRLGSREIFRILVGIIFSFVAAIFGFLAGFTTGFILVFVIQLLVFPVCFAIGAVVTCQISLFVQRILPGNFILPSKRNATAAAIISGVVACGTLYVLFYIITAIHINHFTVIALPLTTILAGIPISWFWLREVYVFKLNPRVPTP